MNADLPQYTASLRRERQNEAFGHAQPGSQPRITHHAGLPPAVRARCRTMILIAAGSNSIAVLMAMKSTIKIKL